MSSERSESQLREGVSLRKSSLPTQISDEIKLGKVLVGDEFTEPQLAEWVRQEQEAFYDGDAGNSDVDPWYSYMRHVNDVLGFSKIRGVTQSGSILVLGPGSGVEVDRFASEHPQWSLHFLEASVNFRSRLREKWPASVIIEPLVSGDISLETNSIDIVCAFSVLHHIANVSKTLRETFRVMRPGGFVFIREPCSSMGDWRFARSATPNERGISRDLLVSMALATGFDLARPPTPVLFEPINKVLKKTIGYSAIPFGVLYAIDRALSSLAALNDYYWRDTWYKKIGPSSYFYVFRKPRT